MKDGLFDPALCAFRPLDEPIARMARDARAVEEQIRSAAAYARRRELDATREAIERGSHAREALAAASSAVVVHVHIHVDAKGGSIVVN